MTGTSRLRRSIYQTSFLINSERIRLRRSRTLLVLTCVFFFRFRIRTVEVLVFADLRAYATNRARICGGLHQQQLKNGLFRGVYRLN
jgi:hypothetical protein